ncbi:DNA repair protein RAD51 -like protein 3 [Trichinella patagoniensis]|uniref:DNA repair protein RAD51 homolog 3 n=1 Tax=Trichinella patagoniensis TaxID=990121 RepID=A0A0V1A8K8_9BILA|nr:DNA repair protein RAD51 -like protein 3 [Trichinella patagoniensis]
MRHETKNKKHAAKNSSITFSCKESGLSICKSPEVCADLGSPSILNELFDQMKFKKKNESKPPLCANCIGYQSKNSVQNLNSVRMECERRLFAQTAKMLLDRDVEDVQSIVTFCESLDNALGGGIQLGQMTECAGPSGIGKTQLCLQLAVDVSIPKVLGGVDGEVIYIDTEGAFKYKRLKQIAEAAVSHCRRVAETEEQQIAANGFTLSKILSRVHYQRCVDLPTLQRCLKSLLCFIRLHSQVKLVIVDSVAMHLRERFDSALERSHVVNNIVLTLLQVATNFHVAIFLVNQITTRFGEDGEPFSVPSVGPLLTSNCAQQLLLFHRQGNLRYARLMKSSTRPPCGAVYTITQSGIRDAADDIHWRGIISCAVVIKCRLRTVVVVVSHCGRRLRRHGTDINRRMHRTLHCCCCCCCCGGGNEDGSGGGGDDDNGSGLDGDVDVDGKGTASARGWGSVTTTTSSREMSSSLLLAVAEYAGAGWAAAVTWSTTEVWVSIAWAKSGKEAFNLWRVRSNSEGTVSNRPAVCMTSSMFFTDSGTDSTRSLFSNSK